MCVKIFFDGISVVVVFIRGWNVFEVFYVRDIFGSKFCEVRVRGFDLEEFSCGYCLWVFVGVIDVVDGVDISRCYNIRRIVSGMFG